MSQREFSPSSPAIRRMRPARSAVVHERFLATGGVAVFRSVLDLAVRTRRAGGASEAPAFFRDLNLDQIVASIIIGQAGIQSCAVLQSAFENGRSHRVPPGRHAGPGGPVPLRRRQRVCEWACGRFGTMSPRRGNCITNTRSRPGRSTPSSSTARPSSNCFPHCARRRPDRPASRVSSPISTPMWRRRSFNSSRRTRRRSRPALASIRYNLLIGSSFVTVSAYGGEADYGAEIQADFEKFRQGAAADHVFKFRDFPQMNHIEAGVLDRVARLFPETFAELESFVARSADFLDPTVYRFDREIQFYVAYLAHMRRIKAPASRSAIQRCRRRARRKAFPNATIWRSPRSSSTRTIRSSPTIISSTDENGSSSSPDPIRAERPPSPARSANCTISPRSAARFPRQGARLFLFDRLFTHFEKEEDIHNLRGKLHDDLYRLRDTLSAGNSPTASSSSTRSSIRPASRTRSSSARKFSRPDHRAGRALPLRHFHRRARVAQPTPRSAWRATSSRATSRSARSRSPGVRRTGSPTRSRSRRNIASRYAQLRERLSP